MDVESFVDEVMNEKKEEKEEDEEKEKEGDEENEEEGMRKRKVGLDNPGFTKEPILNGKPGSIKFNPKDMAGSRTETFSSNSR